MLLQQPAGWAKCLVPWQVPVQSAAAHPLLACLPLTLPARYACSPLYMPTWSLQELQACRAQLYSTVAADTAAERYSWLGGSIRHVLVKTDTDPQQVVLSAVQKQSAKQLVYAINKAFTWASDFSHTLGHFQVCQAVRACGHPH